MRQLRFTKVQTPRGARDFLPSAAARKRQMEASLTALFEEWGYAEIITPAVEFFEALSLGNGADMADKMYKFFDRDGNTLALRPEVTTPIARVVATRFQDEPKPLRLYYVANVFRYEEPQAGRQREFWQAGVELVGNGKGNADAEVVALAGHALRSVGLERFRLDIGQLDFYNGIMEGLDLPDDLRRNLRQALVRRDYVRLEELLVTVPLTEEQRTALRELPRLRGREEVIARARNLSSSPRARAALANLSEIYQLLQESQEVGERVFVDLGMIKELDYYTGMVLEGYTEDLGYTLCTGGRYDNLIGRFGYDCPATGFVLGVERLMLATGDNGRQA